MSTFVSNAELTGETRILVDALSARHGHECASHAKHLLTGMRKVKDVPAHYWDIISAAVRGSDIIIPITAFD
jgi:hypothetical protein